MISKECEKSISNINNLVNKAIKEIKAANARAEAAEHMIEMIKSTTDEEIKKAYRTGYEKGFESASRNKKK